MSVHFHCIVGAGFLSLNSSSPSFSQATRKLIWVANDNSGADVPQSDTVLLRLLLSLLQ